MSDNLRSVILVAFVLCIYIYGQFVGRRDALSEIECAEPRQELLTTEGEEG